MYELPTSIWVNGKEHHIRNNGDYRVILDCFEALEDIELDANERLLASLIIFYDELNSIQDIKNTEDINDMVSEMYNFFGCNSPKSVGTQSNHKLIDWKQDAQLICSAVNKVANTEVRSVPYLHWWTFMGYYTAIGESPISTIIHIRDKIVRNKKLEKHEREFRTNNPQYFVWNRDSVEKNEADELLKEIWNTEG